MTLRCVGMTAGHRIVDVSTSEADVEEFLSKLRERVVAGMIYHSCESTSSIEILCVDVLDLEGNMCGVRTARRGSKNE